MKIKLPNFHVGTALIDYFRKIYLFSYRYIEQYASYEADVNIGFTPGVVIQMADDFVELIRIKGYESECLRRFGPSWIREIKFAIYFNTLMAAYFANEVQSKRFFWRDYLEWFGEYKLLQGNLLWLNTLCASERATEMEGTATRVTFRWKLQGYNELLEGIHYVIAQEGQEDIWNKAVERHFRMPHYQGILERFYNQKDFSEIAKEFEFSTVSLDIMGQQVAICDLLLPYDAVKDLRKLPISTASFTEALQSRPDLEFTFDDNVSVKLLRTDGYSLYSYALGQMFHVNLTDDNIIEGASITEVLYSPWSGQPIAMLRQLRSEIMFGIRFLPAGTSVPTVPGQKPPTPPSGGGGGGGGRPSQPGNSVSGKGKGKGLGVGNPKIPESPISGIKDMIVDTVLNSGQLASKAIQELSSNTEIQNAFLTSAMRATLTGNRDPRILTAGFIYDLLQARGVRMTPQGPTLRGHLPSQQIYHPVPAITGTENPFVD